jgi:acetyl-CoA C-acetyltransferase
MKSIFSNPIYLSAPTRSPIGKLGGSLKYLSAPQLAGITLKQTLAQLKEVARPDFVIMGHARQAGAGPNPARQACILSGLPNNVPALTINQACASGLTSIIHACEKIALKKAHNVLAGGVESMSNTPYLLMQARWGTKMGHGQVLDGMHQDGFFCPMSQMVMGATVENFLVKEFQVSRKEQDEWALESQKRASVAWAQGLFSAETFAIEAVGKNPGLSSDEHCRPDTTDASLAKLPPVFDPKNGTITAGNSSGITDGAAFMLVSDTKNTQTLAEIIDFETVALEPQRMGLGPVESVQNLLKRQNLQISDIDAFELNEAFAAQLIACQRTLKISPEKLNIRGGAIALGHPIGATGARITTTLAHILKNKPGSLGVATLCVSGGHGVSILIRAV